MSQFWLLLFQTHLGNDIWGFNLQILVYNCYRLCFLFKGTVNNGYLAITHWILCILKIIHEILTPEIKWNDMGNFFQSSALRATCIAFAHVRVHVFLERLFPLPKSSWNALNTHYQHDTFKNLHKLRIQYKSNMSSNMDQKW